EREDDGGGVAGCAQQRAEAVAHVARDVLERRASTRGMPLLLVSLHTAERGQRPPPRFDRIDAGALELRRFHVDVKPHLGVPPAVLGGAPGPIPEAHVALNTASTAVENARQLARSSTSTSRPLSVR